MRHRRLISRAEAAHLDLSSRIRLEQQITDSLTEKGKPFSFSTFEHYWEALPYRAHLFKFLGPFAGRQVLDLGCGFNPTPIYFALEGAKHVVACDVSLEAARYVRKLAGDRSVSERVSAVVCAAEQLPFAAESIDFVHGEGVLHHLRLPLASAEIWRVLKRGGRGGFKDPLGHNPLLELARDYLKKSPKGTDRPLNFPDIREFGSRFRVCNYRGFAFLAMIPKLLRLGERSATLTHRFDRYLLFRLPFLERLCHFCGHSRGEISKHCVHDGPQRGDARPPVWPSKAVELRRSRHCHEPNERRGRSSRRSRRSRHRRVRHLLRADTSASHCPRDRYEVFREERRPLLERQNSSGRETSRCFNCAAGR